MPLKMPPHLQHILLQPQILIKTNLIEYILEQWNVYCGNNNREALPIEYVCKWEIIVVSQDHRDTTIIESITNASGVDFVAFGMEAVLAPKELGGIGGFEAAAVGEDF